MVNRLSVFHTEFLTRGLLSTDTPGAIAVVSQPRARLRRLCRELLELQDAERGHMAHALHEGTLQSLAALSWHLSLLSDAVGVSSARVLKLLENCTAMAEACSREITDISLAMHPVVLKDAGLQAALESYVRTMSRAGAEVSFSASGAMCRPTPDTELALFRITQTLTEAMLALPGGPGVAVRVESGAGVTVTHSAHARESCGAGPHSWRAVLEDDVRVLAARERARILGARLTIRVGRAGAATAVLRLDGERWWGAE